MWAGGSVGSGPASPSWIQKAAVVGKRADSYRKLPNCPCSPNPTEHSCPAPAWGLTDCPVPPNNWMAVEPGSGGSGGATGSGRNAGSLLSFGCGRGLDRRPTSPGPQGTWSRPRLRLLCICKARISASKRRFSASTTRSSPEAAPVLPGKSKSNLSPLTSGDELGPPLSSCAT